MARSYTDYFFPLLKHAGFFDIFKTDPSTPDSEINAEYLLDNRWIVGDPAHCLQQIKDLYKEVGGFGTLLLLTQDFDPPELSWKSMELFAKHVAPELRGLVPTGP